MTRHFLSIVCLSVCSFLCAQSCMGDQIEDAGVVFSYDVVLGGVSVYKAELAKVPEGGQPKFNGSLLAFELDGKPVVAIGEDAFAGFAGLRNVSFPNVTRIGANAFSGCADLLSMNFPKLQSVGAGAFDGCRALQSVSFLTCLSTIGANAFSNCGSLESVFVPDGVSSVDDEAFSNCASLKQIVLPLTDTVSWGKDVFAGCSNVENVRGWRPGLGIASSKIADVTFADGIREISDGTFKDCPLPTVGIPDSVVKIGANAFSGCSKLEEVAFGANVQEVGDSAFQNCSSLIAISRFDAVKSIGLDVFKGCLRLSTPVFSEGIIRWYTESLDDGTLRITGVERVQPEVDDHYLLGPVVIPETIDGRRVTDLWFGDFWYCSQVTALEIPVGVRSIGKKSFEGCSSLLSVVFDAPSSLTNIEARAFADCSDLREIELPAQLETLGDSSFAGCSSLSNVVMHTGLERIGAEAFRSCVSLGKAGFTIPETVTEIGKDAFSETDFDKSYRPSDRLFEKDGCVLGWHGTGSNPPQRLAMKTQRMIADGAFEGMTSLESILFEDTVSHIGRDAFAGCSALSAANLPATVEAVGDGAFANCASLEELTVESASTAFGEGVFEGDPIKTVNGWRSGLGVDGAHLEEVVFADGVTEIGEEAFAGAKFTSVTIPATVRTIAANAFAGSALESVTIPATVEAVGDGAFANCASLEELTVASSATAFGEGVFEGDPIKTVTGWRSGLGVDAAALETVAFADGVKEIPAGAFEGSSLVSVEIPEGVTDIGERAFADSKKLTRVVLPESLRRIGAEAFAGCDALEGLDIPEGVESIGRDVFDGGSTGDVVIGWTPESAALGDEVTSVVIADGVTEIPDGAFAGNTRLTSVVIPNSVRRIGFRAFAGCQRLEAIDVPEGVEEIGNYAFSWCVALKDVTLPTTLIRLGDGVFDVCDSLRPIVWGHEGAPAVTPPSEGRGVQPVPTVAIGPRAVTLNGRVREGSRLVGVISVKVGRASTRKGVTTVKVSAQVTDLSGKKKSSKSVSAVVTGDRIDVPGMTVKGYVGTLVISLTSDGLFAGWLGGYAVESAVVGGALAGSPEVAVDFSKGFLSLSSTVQTDLLPVAVPIESTSSGKWSFAKAASVKIRDNVLVVDESKGKTNRSGLKLAYAPKTGVFKGTFNVYCVETTGAGKKRLKRHSVKVSGLVADGVGRGEAVLKNKTPVWTVEVR